MAAAPLGKPAPSAAVPPRSPPPATPAPPAAPALPPSEPQRCRTAAVPSQTAIESGRWPVSPATNVPQDQKSCPPPPPVPLPTLPHKSRTVSLPPAYALPGCPLLPSHTPAPAISAGRSSRCWSAASPPPPPPPLAPCTPAAAPAAAPVALPHASPPGTLIVSTSRTYSVLPAIGFPNRVRSISPTSPTPPSIR